MKQLFFLVAVLVCGSFLYATEGADYSQINKTKRIYGEYRLNQILTTGTTSNDSTGNTYWENTKFIFMPGTNDEFVITDNYNNGTDHISHLFEGFNNCRFVMHDNTDRIVFRPSNTTQQNNIMFSFHNNTNITLENLYIVADYTAQNPNNFTPSSIYVEGLIDVEINNHNFLFTGNKIHGATYDNNPPTAVVNMAISGAVSVGRAEHKETPLIMNTDVFFHSNEIKYFRTFGINLQGVDGAEIGSDQPSGGATYDNEISHIWENDNEWISQSAGIHLDESSNVVIQKNYIHSIFSFFDFSTDCSNVPAGLISLPSNEPRICCSRDANSDGKYRCAPRVHSDYKGKFLHGIYVSKNNSNIDILNNKIGYISGAGIKASPNCVEEGKHLQNIKISGNYIYFTLWFGILIGGVNNIEISSNHIYHSGYRLNYPGYPDPEYGNVGSINLVDNTCHDPDILLPEDQPLPPALISNISLKNNIIKTRHHKIFGWDNFRNNDDIDRSAYTFFSSNASSALKNELRDTTKSYNNVVRIEKYPSGASNIYNFLISDYPNNLYYDTGLGNYILHDSIVGTLNGSCELKFFMEQKYQIFYVKSYDENGYYDPYPINRIGRFSQFNRSEDFPGLFRLEYLGVNGEVSTINCD